MMNWIHNLNNKQKEMLLKPLLIICVSFLFILSIIFFGAGVTFFVCLGIFILLLLIIIGMALYFTVLDYLTIFVLSGVLTGIELEEVKDFFRYMSYIEPLLKEKCISYLDLCVTMKEHKRFYKMCYNNFKEWCSIVNSN